MKTYGPCTECRFMKETDQHDPACFRNPPTPVVANGKLHSVWPLINETAGCFQYEPRPADEDEPPATEATKTDHLASLTEAQAVIIAAYTGHHNLCDKGMLLAYAVDRLNLADNYVLTIGKLASMAAALRQVAAQDLKAILPESVRPQPKQEG